MCLKPPTMPDFLSILSCCRMSCRYRSSGRDTAVTITVGAGARRVVENLADAADAATDADAAAASVGVGAEDEEEDCLLAGTDAGTPSGSDPLETMTSPACSEIEAEEEVEVVVEVET